MSKALKIISIIMPFVVFVLFFIPISFSISDFRNLEGVSGDPLYVESSGSCFDSCKAYADEIKYFRNNSELFLADDIEYAISNARLIIATTAIFFCFTIIISICVAILAQKRPAISVFNCVPLSYFWIWLLSITNGALFETNGAVTTTPHAAFYISLILSAFFLAVFIAYAVKWLKPRLASIPPREHKPTKSERIAELERQVAELKAKEKDAE